jgi:hypothetical protein
MKDRHGGALEASGSRPYDRADGKDARTGGFDKVWTQSYLSNTKGAKFFGGEATKLASAATAAANAKISVKREFLQR